MGGSSVGRKVRRSRGHGLVAVAARVRRTETDRRGKETKRAQRGDIKRKKIEERLVSASGVRMTTRQIYGGHAVGGASGVAAPPAV